MNILNNIGKEIPLDKLFEEHDAKRGILRPLLVYAKDVPVYDTPFIWRNRFPCQQGILAGQQGLGKSLFCGWLASMLTRDDVNVWPDGEACPVGSVLWFSPEGGLPLTSRRLRALGADLGRIAFYSGLWSGKRDVDGEPVTAADPEVTQIREIQQGDRPSSDQHWGTRQAARD